MEKINLQGIGNVKAIKAQDIKAGMLLIWNYGHTSKVIKIADKGTKQIKITTETESGIYERVLSKTRLVGLKG